MASTLSTRLRQVGPPYFLLTSSDFFSPFNLSSAEAVEALGAVSPRTLCSAPVRTNKAPAKTFQISELQSRLDHVIQTSSKNCDEASDDDKGARPSIASTYDCLGAPRRVCLTYFWYRLHLSRMSLTQAIVVAR